MIASIEKSTKKIDKEQTKETHSENSEEGTEIKSLYGDQLFIGCSHGRLLEFSVIEEKIVYDFGRILYSEITSMTKTPDNKLQFMCDFHGGFRELDIPTGDQINSLYIINVKKCITTYDNRFLITADRGTNCFLKKWLVRTKKQLHSWKGDADQSVESQSVSYDSKYQLIGYNRGHLGIFELQKNKTLKNIQVMLDSIYSMAFSRDNQSAFISDFYGNIKIINWKAGTNSEDQLNLIQNFEKVGDYGTYSICLTKDEKYLLVGSNGLVCVFEIATREVAKEIRLWDMVKGISLIQDGKKAIIIESGAGFSIIDLETLEISLICGRNKKIQNLGIRIII